MLIAFQHSWSLKLAYLNCFSVNPDAFRRDSRRGTITSQDLIKTWETALNLKMELRKVTDLAAVCLFLGSPKQLLSLLGDSHLCCRLFNNFLRSRKQKLLWASIGGEDILVFLNSIFLDPFFQTETFLKKRKNFTNPTTEECVRYCS